MTLIWRPGFQFDTDASNYIEAVEAADTQALETATRYAINDFVIGCKQDGIWSAIKASCILAGARTLAGALVPLVGTAPDSFSFVDADYNRKTGLLGDGSAKYLDSKRANNADPQNSNHNAVYATTVGGNSFMGADGSNTNPTNWLTSGGCRNRSISQITLAGTAVAGLYGFSRTVSTDYTIRNNRQNFNSGSNISGSPDSLNVFIFRRNNVSALGGSHRLAFYSIGESLDLALLDARVSALITAFGVAIP